MVNQRVAHELLALQLCELLLQQPTNDSVEVCVGFLKVSKVGLGSLHSGREAWDNEV